MWLTVCFRFNEKLSFTFVFLFKRKREKKLFDVIRFERTILILYRIDCSRRPSPRTHKHCIREHLCFDATTKPCFSWLQRHSISIFVCVWFSWAAGSFSLCWTIDTWTVRKWSSSFQMSPEIPFFFRFLQKFIKKGYEFVRSFVLTFLYWTES